jgi:RNA exonuclease 4
MVGVGPEGEESSLARVSIVNFHGAVQLDIFVRQRELVTDWRTSVSGITPHHMHSAVTFSNAQKQVADLIKDRILIGHAIENDLKALLLSHPRNLVRDTQKLARKSKLLGGSRMPGLKKLIQKEFDITIQAGRHDSV